MASGDAMAALKKSLSSIKKISASDRRFPYIRGRSLHPEDHSTTLQILAPSLSHIARLMYRATCVAHCQSGYNNNAAAPRSERHTKTQHEMTTMSSPVLSLSRRLRKSPYESRSHAGAKAASVYNHVVLPTAYASLEEDY